MDNHITALLNLYNAEDMESLMNRFDLSFKFSSNNSLNITNRDPLYASYASYSFVYNLPLKKVLDKYEFREEDKTTIKNIVTRKVRQQRILAQIKAKGIDIIMKYIEKTFKIDEKLITPSDIIWHEYNRFSIGEAMFNYSGTISYKAFVITSQCYVTHENMYHLVTGIQNYYKKKVK